MRRYIRALGAAILLTVITLAPACVVRTSTTTRDEPGPNGEEAHKHHDVEVKPAFPHFGKD